MIRRPTAVRRPGEVVARPLVIAALILILAESAAGDILFRDVSEAWSLAFRHHHGGSGERYMVETVVAGVVLFDFDFDGDVDVFFVDGGHLPGYEGEEPLSRLFRNEGGGRFRDATASAGIHIPGYGCGGTAGDVDNDGDLDLYVTVFGTNRLLRNNGDGTFADVTEKAHVGESLWSSSASFSDVDLDGDLDLYVTNYVAFTLGNHRFCGNEETGLQGYCHPVTYEGLPDRFYVNRGDGVFDDATEASGFAGATEAGLGLIFGDLNGDRWPDLYVANDADPNFCFINRGDGTFEDRSLVSGTAYSDSGSPEGSMGVDMGDVDGDGRPDLVVTNFEYESNVLYRALGGGLFIDDRFAAKLAEPSLRSLAFGVALADFDHDGDLDAIMANGHILDNAEVFDELSRYAQRNQVFENLGQGRFEERDETGVDAIRVSRGLAVADLDGDGDLEVVIMNSNDYAEVYENVGPSSNRAYVLVDLVGGASNRFGVDGRITLVAGGRRQIRDVRTASSYLSQGALTAHIGLGAAQRIGSLELLWPSGKRQRYADLPVGSRYRFWESPAAGAGR